MTKKIIWSSLSEKDFSGIMSYLNKEWDAKVSKHFIDIIEEVLEQISLNPKQFPLINKKRKVRKSVLTKHNTLFYQDRKEYISILRIYDTRQDPEKLKFD